MLLLMKLLMSLVGTAVLLVALLGCTDLKITMEDQENTVEERYEAIKSDTKNQINTQVNRYEKLYGKWVLEACIYYGADLSEEEFMKKYIGRQIEFGTDFVVTDQEIKGITYTSKMINAEEFFEEFNWYSYDEIFKDSERINILEILIEKDNYEIVTLYFIQNQVYTVDGGSIFRYKKVQAQDLVEKKGVGSDMNESKQQITSLKYNNEKLGFSLDIPQSWKGKYVIDEGQTSISIKHSISDGIGDEILYIGIFGTKDTWDAENDGEDVFPWHKIGERNNLMYVSYMPGESNYDLETEQGREDLEEYIVLRECVSDILNTFEFLEGN